MDDTCLAEVTSLYVSLGDGGATWHHRQTPPKTDRFRWDGSPGAARGKKPRMWSEAQRIKYQAWQVQFVHWTSLKITERSCADVLAMSPQLWILGWRYAAMGSEIPKWWTKVSQAQCFRWPSALKSSIESIEKTQCEGSFFPIPWPFVCHRKKPTFPARPLAQTLKHKRNHGRWWFHKTYLWLCRFLG